MNRNFLHLYNVELQHIRQTAAEFAREYPKIAARLALDPDGKEACPDPFVERLLEGFAFLAARVQAKLDAEFPRFTQSLLETVYPAYLSPIPSMAVLHFEPELRNKALAGGFAIPRDTPIRTAPLGRIDHTRCTYRTAHDVTLWPIQLREARYLDRTLLSLDLPAEARASAALHLTLDATAELTFADIPVDELTFFLRGTDNLPAQVIEHLFAHGTGAWGRADGAHGAWCPLPAGCVRPVGFDRSESLLPQTPTTFEGHRLLTEYFAFPQRFLFFRVAGLQSALAGAGGTSLELALTLDQPAPKIGPRVNETLFSLFATPVINLFEKRTDRVELSSRFPEFHVVVDRTRPIDYEVYAIKSVTAYGVRSGEEQSFLPFYLARDRGVAAPAYFTINRQHRSLTEKEKKFGQLSSYAGSEVYLSLVDGSSAPYASTLQQLGITALCTNRHLPLRLSQGDGVTDFVVELNGPVKSVRCLAGPTAPRSSFAMGEVAWRLISHLSLNYFSLMDTSEADGAVALRELLQLYVDPEDRSMQKQVDGVQSVTVKPILRRMPTPGIITFARGLEVSVRFDEEAFVGSDVFLFGMVLEQFFARQVSINSFTETVIHSRQRGEIIRWPARTGRKQIL